MELKILSRRPIKIVLLCLLLALALTASLLLSLQYSMDSLGLDYAREYYSYCATIESTYSKTPGLDVLADEALAILEETPYISQIDRRVTLSAKANDLQRAADLHLAFDLASCYIFVGTIEGEVKHDTNGLYATDVAEFRVDKIYAGFPDLEACEGVVLTQAMRTLDSKLEAPKSGERYLAIGFYGHDRKAMVFPDQINVWYDHPWEIFQQDVQYDRALFSTGLTPVPKDLTGDELDTWVQGHMEQQGLDEYAALMNETEHMFTAVRTNNMDTLFPVIDEKMFYTEGRGLRPEDYGKPVCVMSEKLADQNGLTVGDHVSLALAEECYTSGESIGSNDIGVESGVPFTQTDGLLPYGDSREYEIIGLYSFTERSIMEDVYSYSYNDVFIPFETKQDTLEGARPYTLSVRIAGADYEDFLNDVETPLMEQGYALRVSESDWDSVKGIYTEMETRQGLTLLGVGIALVVVILIFAMLIMVLYQKEFALRRVLGANRKEAKRSFTVPFLVAAVTAAPISLAVCWIVYSTKLRVEAQTFAPGQVPENGTMLLLLIGVAVLVLLAAYGVLRLMVALVQRKSLVDLLS